MKIEKILTSVKNDTLSAEDSAKVAKLKSGRVYQGVSALQIVAHLLDMSAEKLKLICCMQFKSGYVLSGNCLGVKLGYTLQQLANSSRQKAGSDFVPDGAILVSGRWWQVPLPAEKQVELQKAAVAAMFKRNEEAAAEQHKKIAASIAGAAAASAGGGSDGLESAMGQDPPKKKPKLTKPPKQTQSQMSSYFDAKPAK